ncbi:hypothetical protein CFOL_v3_33184 [Cephalotus follicularis]|uniref:Uncharacterized protein n=1 Tax=Cephalotus follicularis TaxID=3775 RepID=A0A1Q3DBE0_CEPFO|nr:hypothetical protein CFOL_v3_33184 [Cephalotus follicularis]
MSKKRAFSGNTMTLKDFHGGSIPTDLPLPSAPGVVVRCTDRSGYERPSSWGNPMGPPDQRNRPNSSPATRHFDDKTPFVTCNALIGRNFDEDERKPLDGVSAPRRTVSDESFRVLASWVEPKLHSVSSGRSSVLPLSSAPVNSYSGRVSEVAHVGVSSQNFVGSSGQGGSGAYPNAWVAKKDAVVRGGSSEPVKPPWSEVNAVSKLAHASAFEKVSSGRWHSKPIHYQTDVEVSRYSAMDNGLRTKGSGENTANRTDAMGGREYHDATLVRHVEGRFGAEDESQGSRKELVDYERGRSSTNLEVKERISKVYADGIQCARPDGKFGGSEMQHGLPLEVAERPKLKLLPRTKPLENLEPPVMDRKQVYQRLSDSAYHCHTEFGNEVHGYMNPAKSVLAGSECGNKAEDRHKLNLNPRSQPLEPLEGNTERGRNYLFGGARPRELVLKERGINVVTLNNHDSGLHSDRIKFGVSKTERASGHAISSRHSERPDNVLLDQRTQKKSENRDHRVDVDRVDMRRRNWHNENRRNGRETERQQQQQKERQRSPETWRKIVDQPKPATHDVVGLRYGKATSAVELAQAFSRSFSDPKPDDRYSGQRRLPGNSHMPFSRLMGPTSRTQINGY